MFVNEISYLLLSSSSIYSRIRRFFIHSMKFDNKNHATSDLDLQGSPRKLGKSQKAGEALNVTSDGRDFHSKRREFPLVGILRVDYTSDGNKRMSIMVGLKSRNSVTILKVENHKIGKVW